jgi:hypothetical protein
MDLITPAVNGKESSKGDACQAQYTHHTALMVPAAHIRLATQCLLHDKRIRLEHHTHPQEGALAGPHKIHICARAAACWLLL